MEQVTTFIISPSFQIAKEAEARVEEMGDGQIKFGIGRDVHIVGLPDRFSAEIRLYFDDVETLLRLRDRINDFEVKYVEKEESTFFQDAEREPAS